MNVERQKDSDMQDLKDSENVFGLLFFEQDGKLLNCFK